MTKAERAEREQPAFPLGKYEKDSIAKDFAEISTLYNYIGILANLNVDVYTFFVKNEIKVVFHFIMAYLMYSWNQLNPAVSEPSLFAYMISTIISWAGSRTDPY